MKFAPPSQYLFGTDFPAEDPASTLNELKKLDLPPDTLKALYRGNAERLFPKIQSLTVSESAPRRPCLPVLGSKQELIEAGTHTGGAGCPDLLAARVVIVGAALGLICLVTSAQGWGQTKDGQNKESQAKNGQAKDSQARDRRLEDAQLDIRLLKQVVDEQARRITQLEKAVKALEAAAAGPAEERTKVVRNPRWSLPGRFPLRGPESRWACHAWTWRKSWVRRRRLSP